MFNFILFLNLKKYVYYICKGIQPYSTEEALGIVAFLQAGGN